MQKGSLTIYLIIIIVVFIIVIFPISAFFSSKLKLLRAAIQREQALQIAEAGVNYYQWHLAHFNSDYQDRTNPTAYDQDNGAVYGPFSHDYKDFDTQKTIGRFDLTITAPSAGTSAVTIKSVGYTLENPDIKRTVTVEYGNPSLSKYSFLSNSDAWFFYNEEINGIVHSNTGIRFDGMGNGKIESAVPSYTCPWWQTDFGGNCPSVKNPAIWCVPVDPAAGCPAANYFQQSPAVSVDFDSINIGNYQTLAQQNGIFLPALVDSPGYLIVFKDDAKVEIYKVTSVIANSCDVTDRLRTKLGTPTLATRCTDYNEKVAWGVGSYSMPANGIIFSESDVWVEGVVNGRAMVVAGAVPFNDITAPNIYIQNNITYKNSNGSDALGLLSQRDIAVTLTAPSTMEINASLITQKGVFQHYYYNNSGTPKDTLIINGSIINFGPWYSNLSYTAGSDINSLTVIQGYGNVEYNYNTDILYNPPPGFPAADSSYSVLKWTSD